MNLADSHNHLHFLGDPEAVIAAMQSAGVVQCVVNATCQADWPQVAALAEAHPAFVLPAFGIHPWHAHTADGPWLEQLRRFLERFPTASIGECGLDRWVDSPTLEVQRPVFEAQVSLARTLDRPLTIHCLRAWGALFDTFERCPPPRRFLLHSFGGSLESARRLLPLGACFSLSGHFLHPRKQAALDTFRDIPRDSILLETDAPDMTPPAEHVSHPLPDGRNHPANLPLIARGLARALGDSESGFRELTLCNHRRFFFAG